MLPVLYSVKEGALMVDTGKDKKDQGRSPETLTPEELAAAFSRIRDADVRASIAALVLSLADTPENDRRFDS